MADVIDETRRRLAERLAELQPALDEARRIEAALAALEDEPISANGRRTGKQQAFVEFIRDHPHASMREIADALNTKPSYASQIKRKLVASGIVRGGGSEPWTVLDALKPVDDATPDHPGR